MKKFIFGRVPIEGEKRSSDLDSKATEPYKLDAATDETLVDVDLIAPTNFSVESERVVIQPDGTYKVEVMLSWDDQGGAQDYEIWVSEEQ